MTGPGHAIGIDLTIEAGAWGPEADLESLVGRAVAATADEMPVLKSGESELSVVFTDDAAVRALNASWRARDKPTNVLSFPAFPAFPAGRLPPMLGDIVLARETVEAEAGLDDKPVEHHVAHLVVHGLLHLLGHDHVEDGQAEAMEEIERRVLARLAIPDPYR